MDPNNYQIPLLHIRSHRETAEPFETSMYAFAHTTNARLPLGNRAFFVGTGNQFAVVPGACPCSQ